MFTPQRSLQSPRSNPSSATALAVIAAALAALATVVSAQLPRFGTRTDVVLVDVSVTDQKGRPVVDLTRGDFEVYEDGVLQRVLTSGRHSPNPEATANDAARVAGLPAGGGGIAPNESTPASAQTPAVVALAFDRLSPEGRELAHRAAVSFVEHKQPDELVGVFIVDKALATLAPYTTDAEKIRAAVERAAETATSQLARVERHPLVESFFSSSDTPYVAGAEEKGRAAGQLPWVDPLAKVAGSGDYALVKTLEMLIRMELSYKDMLYEQQGQASMNALLALVDSLGTVPGRKAVIYFCEGLTIPPSVQPKFQAIIDTANRSNVTVYTIDAAGLRVQSKQGETARAVQEYGAMGIGDVQRGDKYLDALENNERVLKLDPAVSLGILARQTGGLLVDNTNDLERGIGRIRDDWRHYYLLSYSSTNPALDGTFRRIQVNVKRRKVQVRSRSGYLAAPLESAGPVFSYETPALAALHQATPPAAFPITAGAFSVPMPGRPGLTAVFVNVPGTSLSFRVNPTARTYDGNVVILARIRGGNDAERKLSQDFRFKGALDRVAETKEQRVLFFRTPELRPGTYRVDAAVHDGASDYASVVTTILRVPDAARPVIGDLILIDHAERMDPAANADGNPLVVDGLQLLPAFDPTFSLRSRKEINFALSMLLEPGAPAPDALLSVTQNGSVLSSVTLPMGSTAPGGRLMAVGRVPLTSLPPGHYDLRMTVGAGPGAQVRTATMNVTE